MMSKSYLILQKVLMCTLFAILTSCAATTKQPEISQPTAIKVGSQINQSAPAFTAIDLGGRSFALSDYRGKSIVLVFYIGHR